MERVATVPSLVPPLFLPILRNPKASNGWQPLLDSVTRQSVERFEMTGMERALLYAIAIQTGLRSAELRSLTRGKLSLKSEPPFITAEARSTKNKKAARQYIQRELAGELMQLVGKKTCRDVGILHASQLYRSNHAASQYGRSSVSLARHFLRSPRTH